MSAKRGPSPALRNAGNQLQSLRAHMRAAELAPVIAELQEGGARTLREIAAGLSARRVPTARGGKWHAKQVLRVLARLRK